MDRNFGGFMTKPGQMWRGVLALALTVLMTGLAGCAGRAPGKPAVSAIDERLWRVDDARHFSGLVVADEPQAVAAGQSILEQGGNAVDAATAVYFALSVTYSGAAGLGGGGSCLVHEASAQRATIWQIDFPVKTPAGRIGIPGNIAGFGWMNAHYGSLPWASLLAPATQLASGALMSRATRAQIRANRSLSALPEGLVQGVGQPMDQPTLLATLTKLQKGGADAFYGANLGARFLADAQGQGGAITPADLQAYEVMVSHALSTPMGKGRVFTRRGTKVQNSVWMSAIDGSRPLESDMNSLRSVDAGSTSFVVADAEGGAAACVISMNGAFGSGQVSRSTGIYFSSAQDTTSLSNMVMVRQKKRGLVYIGASGGGASGLQKSAATLAEVALSKISPLARALRQNQNSGFDPVNVISCKGGLKSGPASCHFGSEPSSNGHALLAK